MEYRIERLSAQNIRHLLPLYRAAFHQRVSLSFLLKKYNTRAVGAEFIGFIAFAPKEIAVAYYGVIPCFFQLMGKTVVAAQSADTMTHPGYRKKGLFQRLAAQTYELARKQNIRFIFGFPNQNSLPGFVKLQWQFLPDQFQVFTAKTGGVAYARLLRKSPFLFSFYKFLVSLIFGGDRMEESFFGKEITDGVCHNNTFIAYKTYSTTFVANINNIKAWIKADGKLKVGAVQGLDKNNLTVFLHRLKKLATRLGCSEVIFMTSKHSRLYEVLNEKLLPENAFPIGFLPLQPGLHAFESVFFEYCDVDIF